MELMEILDLLQIDYYEFINIYTELTPETMREFLKDTGDFIKEHIDD